MLPGCILNCRKRYTFALTLLFGYSGRLRPCDVNEMYVFGPGVFVHLGADSGAAFSVMFDNLSMMWFGLIYAFVHRISSD